MNSFSFGQYYPSDSIIHKMDPRAKILISLVYMVAVFFVVSYVGYAFTLLALLAVTIIAKVPFKVVLKSVKGILFILVFTALLNVLFYKQGKVLVSFWKITITLGGIDYAIKMILRLGLLVMGTSMLTFTTSATELTDGLESLLKPLSYIKVPVHDIAIIMSIALRFIPSLTEETQKIMQAQKARGANIDTGNFFQRVKAMIPILIPLFVSAFRRADELANALDARCYNASPKRTKMKVLKMTVKDLVALALVAAFITLICLDKYLVPGGMGLDIYIVEFIKGLSL